MAIAAAIPEALALAVNAPTWAQDNGAWLRALIQKHTSYLIEEGILGFQAAYDGDLDSITTRDKDRGDGINNKLQVNLSQLIIDTVVDYLTGKPIIWTVEDGQEGADTKLLEEYRKTIIPLLRKNESQLVLAELLRQGSIGGYGAVIAWVDEKGQIDFNEYPLNEVIPVYDTKGRLCMVVRYYTVQVEDIHGQEIEKTRAEVYDEKYVTYYLGNDGGDGFELDEDEIPTGNPVEHRAGRIPVAIFTNGTPARYVKRVKKGGVSDLGNGVLTLLEAYAHGMSDKANYVEYLQDAYLLLKGVDVDEKEVVKMRKARALALTSVESDASFIAQDQEDAAVENNLNRLRDTIHDQTQIPRLNDISGTTATEVKMKYVPLDIKAGKKELYFTSAIMQLAAIVTDMLNAKRLIDAGVADEEVYNILAGIETSKTPLFSADWLQFTINRNLPQNFKEIADIVAVLSGKVPDAYLYELLWFIDDPVKALADMKEQAQATADMTASTALGFGAGFAGTGNVDNTGTA
ncbi:MULTISPECIES: phage portal protein [Pelosinus]|uniref:Bacteriophage portal protein, SPP1 Gp6-like protein n=1 Tax=Pelosinus fermentans B4 TaxID=1149862 RepID=I9LHE2_9FIRM|nr:MULTISPECIES: phage portal protein [Pelosinus]EIW19924.1 Bacteriophage portal protein, SPP1 Gp6-like protein [Pelosinus fermentans B4]EIW21219.1 portal protein SPP1 [Pelosinus fermentans A11]